MTDYGNPDKADDFKILFTYSPVHNVRQPKNGQQYPAMLLLTGTFLFIPLDHALVLHTFWHSNKFSMPFTPIAVAKQEIGLGPKCALSTGDHDDRVSPLHSHKLLAELQYQLAGKADSSQRNPLVARIEVRTGHGAGKPTEKVGVVCLLHAQYQFSWLDARCSRLDFHHVI